MRAAAAAALLAAPGLGLDNGLARTPPMGWCSWNGFHRNFNESLFYRVADAMVSTGMRAAGYEYLNIDGGWWQGSDTGTIARNATGFMQWNTEKFPGGLPKLIAYVHSKGLRWGHYTDAGKHACNGDAPMSEGYEHQDATLFAEWGADMLKVDACGDAEPAETIVSRWEKELNATGRPILFSNCHNGCQTKTPWEPWCAQYANMWRSSGDISASWSRMMSNLHTLRGRGRSAGPGAWNDPDFLEVGIRDFKYDGTERSVEMNRAHFSMWCVTSSPLIASPDLSSAPPEILDVLLNADAIAINQAYDAAEGDAGDLIAEQQQAQPAAALPVRPFPFAAACDATSPTQRWALNGSWAGEVAEEAGGKVWNVQNCEAPVILYAASHGKGCGGGHNEEFALSADGRLSTGPAYTVAKPGQNCVSPTGPGGQLMVGDCPAAGTETWRYDAATKQLRVAAADGTERCVDQNNAPPTPAPAPAAGKGEVWYKPLPGGEAAVALLNAAESGAALRMNVSFALLPSLRAGATTTCSVADVWAKRTVAATGEFVADAVAPQSARLLRIGGCK